jgi:signal transduction histidine kinase
MRRRILATVVAVAALAVIAFLVPTALTLRSTIRHSDLLELQREAAIVASRIEPSDLVDVRALEQLIDPDHDLAFYDSSGHLIDGEGPATADGIAGLAVTGTFAEGYVGNDLVVAVPLRPSEAGPGLVVRIREPGAESEHRMLVRLIWLGVAAIGVIGAAGVVGWLLARRLSRPLENLRDRAGELGQLADVGPPTVTGVAEIDQLSAAMSDAAARIRELLRRERSFSSNVSHQLRTPVAALRIAIEAELDAPRPDATDVLQESLVALDRLGSTITSLLALARHTELAATTGDVRAVVGEAVVNWSAPFAESNRAIIVEGSAGDVVVDPSSLRHIIDVLLDNALAHGRGDVVITLRERDHVEVDVADSGSMPANADPFSEQRIDTSHGIGLRLARTLAESAGGELSVVPGPRTIFRLSAPAAVRSDTAAPDRAQLVTVSAAN